MITAIVVDDPNELEPSKTLAMFNVPNRSLDEVEWTTAVENIKDRGAGTKVLVNPNTIILIDERGEDERDNES